MQVKKYEAKSMQEALKKIKTELGPEAVILKAKRKKSMLGVGQGGVEVTAAIGKGSLLKKQYAESRMPVDTAEKLKNSSARVQKEVYDKYAERIRKNTVNENTGVDQASLNFIRRKPILQTRYIDINDEDTVLDDGTVVPNGPAVKVDISAMPQKTAEPVKKQLGRPLTEALVGDDEGGRPDLERYSRRIYITEKLKFEGIESFYVDQIMLALDEITGGNLEEVEDALLDRLLIRIMASQIRVTGEADENSDGPRIMAFVGTGGTGKTTTVAKIAARYFIDDDLNVAVICCDTNNIGSVEQLKVYCRIMNIPLKVASDAAELVAAMRELSECDVILIDTPSISHREQDKLNDLNSLLSIEYPVQTSLVISATTRDAEIREILEYYNITSYSSLIFTKMDEAAVFGGVFNALVASKKPLAFITTGRKVPENIFKPAADELAGFILNRKRL